MSFSAVQTAMAKAGYMASDDLAVALHLAISLQRPILLEGAAGVGKTEVARVLAAARKAAGKSEARETRATCRVRCSGASAAG